MTVDAAWRSIPLHTFASQLSPVLGPAVLLSRQLLAWARYYQGSVFIVPKYWAKNAHTNWTQHFSYMNSRTKRRSNFRSRRGSETLSYARTMRWAVASLLWVFQSQHCLTSKGPVGALQTWHLWKLFVTGKSDSLALKHIPTCTKKKMSSSMNGW